ncbi:MAG: ATP-binding cassette domain-containing protein [Chloroflexota bacterium]
MHDMKTPGTYPPLIEYRNVTLLRNNTKALDKLSLSINVGEHIAILGPNGAGKSSLIKTITRELYPVAENHNSYLRILGKELWDVAELRDKLGIVGPDLVKSSFADFSCEEVVLSGFFGSTGIWPYHRVTIAMQDKAKEVMRLMRIYHLRKASINEISTGESRLVMIGRALVNDPLAMLLDEPTVSLDPQAARKVRHTLRKISRQGKTIVMITHNLSDIIPEIQRVVLIRNGKVVQDGEKDKILTTAFLSALFGVKLEVVRRDGYYYCW